MVHRVRLVPEVEVEVVCAHSVRMDSADIRVDLAGLAVLVVVVLVVVTVEFLCRMGIGAAESDCRMVDAEEVVEAAAEAGRHIEHGELNGVYDAKWNFKSKFARAMGYP
jgi:hypothetical protein